MARTDPSAAEAGLLEGLATAAHAADGPAGRSRVAGCEEEVHPRPPEVHHFFDAIHCFKTAPHTRETANLSSETTVHCTIPVPLDQALWHPVRGTRSGSSPLQQPSSHQPSQLDQFVILATMIVHPGRGLLKLQPDEFARLQG